MAILDAREAARILGGEARNGSILCPGPGHSPEDRSLSVTIDPSAPDGFLVHSFAGDDPVECKDYVREKLGLDRFGPKKKKANGADWGNEVGRYVYRLADGTSYLQVRKFVDDNGRKQFPQSRWEGGAWVNGKPKGEKIPYRLPELVAAPPSVPVYICEGEKDCEALAQLSLVATCNSEGAGKWSADLNSHFRGRNVVILPDNDLPGRRHAEQVARALEKVAASIRIVELPGLPLAGDVSDWLQNDRGGARLLEECARAPLWDPGGRDQARIIELAELDKLRYARSRKDVAKELGVPAADLDKLVADARLKPGKEPERWHVDPWTKSVATADLLAALVDLYARHVVLPQHGATAQALWTLHAWAIDAAYVSPIIMLVSPEPRCGKSTALSLIFRTAPRTAMASNISAAAIYRYVEMSRPTLLLDEAETFVVENEDVRGVLNSGHTRDTAHVIRLVADGDDYVAKMFSTWAAKALASIGKLAATLRDRAIIVLMKRRKAGERVEKLRVEDTAEFLALRRKAQRWVDDNIEALKKARPTIPEALNDRAQDNWEPMLAIADLAAGDWPVNARKAAIALTQDLDEGSIRTKLLADIRKVFDVVLAADRVLSRELATELAELAKRDEEAGPWGAFGKEGRPITQRQIARLLSEFAITPRTVRADQTTSKGYLREQFVDAFDRYVLPYPPAGSVTPSQTSDNNDLEKNLSVTKATNVTDQNDLNPLIENDCDGVTDQKPPCPEGDPLRSLYASEDRSAEDAVKALENRGFVVSCPLNGAIVFADRRAKPGERARTPPQPLMNAVYDNADAVAQFLSRREKERGF